MFVHPCTSSRACELGFVQCAPCLQCKRRVVKIRTTILHSIPFQVAAEYFKQLVVSVFATARALLEMISTKFPLGQVGQGVY